MQKFLEYGVYGKDPLQIILCTYYPPASCLIHTYMTTEDVKYKERSNSFYFCRYLYLYIHMVHIAGECQCERFVHKSFQSSQFGERSSPYALIGIQSPKLSSQLLGIRNNICVLLQIDSTLFPPNITNAQEAYQSFCGLWRYYAHCSMIHLDLHKIYIVIQSFLIWNPYEGESFGFHKYFNCTKDLI